MTNTRKERLESRVMYIPVINLLNSRQRPWTLVNNEILDLAEIMMETIRAMPVKTFGEGERGLDIIETIRDRLEDEWIELLEVDFEWMIDLFMEGAHLVWKAPDGVLLVRHLIKAANVGEKPIEVPG